MGQRSPRPLWSSRIRLTSYFTAKNVQKGRPVKYLDIIQSICLFQDHGITGLSEVSYSTRQSVSPVSTDRGTSPILTQSAAHSFLFSRVQTYLQSPKTRIQEHTSD